MIVTVLKSNLAYILWELLWGSSIGEDYGTFWRQCHVLGFQPKMFITSRGESLQRCRALGRRPAQRCLYDTFLGSGN